MECMVRRLRKGNLGWKAVFPITPSSSTRFPTDGLLSHDGWHFTHPNCDF